jgi:hypothetical protein
VRLPDQPVGKTLSATFPASSMTLFVLLALATRRFDSLPLPG